jgi:FtsP/CotA-like multicopper oxidase with cupredoxin domain
MQLGTQTATGQFPRDVKGLLEARRPEALDLRDGDSVHLRIGPVAKRLGDLTVRMLAYNGSIPGSTLRVRQGSKLVVNVVNEGDLEATVHWHGLRLENRYDGTHETQAPIPVGGRFTYRIDFPDPGVYWYHPHIRQDYGQEMGLYGNILVQPADADYWPPVHREIPVTLDDVLVEDESIAPFDRSETTYSAMGRFGNVFLIDGETDLQLDAKRGEVVRFYLTNTANTRVFNVAFAGAPMKLVGADSGRYEHERFVESVILAPSERAVVDVLFERPGTIVVEHRTPERTYSIASIDVSDELASPSLADRFQLVRHNPEWAAIRDRLAPYLHKPPDKTLALVAEMELAVPEGPVIYACPMHPDAVSETPDRCPKCGMKLIASSTSAHVCPMHPDVVSDKPDHCPKCGMKLLPAQLVAQASAHTSHGGHRHQHDPANQSRHSHEHAQEGAHADRAHEDAGGIEWEDDMVDVNRLTTPANTRWKVLDRETGAVGHAIEWTFRVGDQVKLRLVNEMDSDHPMHHPFHIHGAGRFIILTRDGLPEDNLVWKDTVLIRTGETVDILLDVTHPGRWMAHCHIAEHHESGMMFSFNVVPRMRS